MFESTRLFIQHATFLNSDGLAALVGQAGSTDVVEQTIQARRAHGRDQRPSVFVAHHHTDAPFTEQFVALLRTLCPDIYVDWCDPATSPFQNSATARLVRARVKEARKFILMASPGSLSSTWRQWELGFATGIKPLNDIALVPLLDPQGDWPFVDYLRIYHRIVEATPQACKPREQIVVGPDELSLSLARWLAP